MKEDVGPPGDPDRHVHDRVKVTRVGVEVEPDHKARLIAERCPVGPIGQGQRAIQTDTGGHVQRPPLHWGEAAAQHRGKV
jgi:hypothetical protein